MFVSTMVSSVIYTMLSLTVVNATSSSRTICDIFNFNFATVDGGNVRMVSAMEVKNISKLSFSGGLVGKKSIGCGRLRSKNSRSMSMLLLLCVELDFFFDRPELNGVLLTIEILSNVGVLLEVDGVSIEVDGVMRTTELLSNVGVLLAEESRFSSLRSYMSFEPKSSSQICSSSIHCISSGFRLSLTAEPFPSSDSTVSASPPVAVPKFVVVLKK